MNPSAAGWILKHFPVIEQNIFNQNWDQQEFYTQLKTSGFIYANSLQTPSYPKETIIKWTIEEKTKINLLDALIVCYKSHNAKLDQEDCLSSIIKYYKSIEDDQEPFWKLFKLKSSPAATLEKILQERIKNNQSALQKNFSNLLTNALLYLDVLGYEKYLESKESPKEYLKNTEAIIINTMFLAFKQKSEKNNYEDMVLKLLQTSLRYTNQKPSVRELETINFKNFNKLNEKRYLLDLACITVFNDEKIEQTEQVFIHNLGSKLDFPLAEIDYNLGQSQSFLRDHKKEISYFEHTNAIHQAYKNTHKLVKVLILRNKKRLILEIKQSGELMLLLHKSTHKNLTEEERKKVKEQLLDICKTVPSLAIFVMPGGSILLPILIKFIPQLLPSAFNDNRIEN